MKITIDTKEDAPEDIRKVIAMLSALVDAGHAVTSPPLNMFSDGQEKIPNAGEAPSVFDIFTQQKEGEEKKEETETEEKPGLIFEY